MPRFVVFLRGVSPGNLQMSQLRGCLESAGFTKVKTMLSSGNAVFESRSRSVGTIERLIEQALEKQVGRSFYPIVRSIDELNELIESDPYAPFGLPAEEKKVVTFARELLSLKSPLPIEKSGARILATRGREAFSAYLPGPRGPVFMELIKAHFGTEVTTRTWETVKKCASA